MALTVHINKGNLLNKYDIDYLYHIQYTNKQFYMLNNRYNKTLLVTALK